MSDTGTKVEKKREPRQPMDRLRSQKKPQEVRHTVVLDPGLELELADVEGDIAELRVRIDNGDDTPARQKALDTARHRAEELRAAIDDATIKFVFRSIGRKRYSALLDEHEPTNTQFAEAKRKDEEPPVYNEDTFPQALIAASAVEPEGVTLDDVRGLWDDDSWSASELNALWNAALLANIRLGSRSLGNG